MQRRWWPELGDGEYVYSSTDYTRAAYQHAQFISTGDNTYLVERPHTMSLQVIYNIVRMYTQHAHTIIIIVIVNFY